MSFQAMTSVMCRFRRPKQKRWTEADTQTHGFLPRNELQDTVSSHDPWPGTVVPSDHEQLQGLQGTAFSDDHWPGTVSSHDNRLDMGPPGPGHLQGTDPSLGNWPGMEHPSPWAFADLGFRSLETYNTQPTGQIQGHPQTTSSHPPSKIMPSNDDMGMNMPMDNGWMHSGSGLAHLNTSWSPTPTTNYKRFKTLCIRYAQHPRMVYTRSMFTTLLAFGAASFVVVSAVPIDTNSGPSPTSTLTFDSHTPTSTSLSAAAASSTLLDLSGVAPLSQAAGDLLSEASSICTLSLTSVSQNDLFL
ncbi:hypothetical protein F5880DRAFT_1618655 [Lentinula raphanica]|nr:hypothetical protein F5880DRAFT_1618655 [Lentinula raphanica]